MRSTRRLLLVSVGPLQFTADGGVSTQSEDEPTLAI